MSLQPQTPSGKGDCVTQVKSPEQLLQVISFPCEQYEMCCVFVNQSLLVLVLMVLLFSGAGSEDDYI